MPLLIGRAPLHCPPCRYAPTALKPGSPRAGAGPSQLPSAERPAAARGAYVRVAGKYGTTRAARGRDSHAKVTRSAFIPTRVRLPPRCQLPQQHLSRHSRTPAAALAPLASAGAARRASARASPPPSPMSPSPPSPRSARRGPGSHALGRETGQRPADAAGGPVLHPRGNSRGHRFSLTEALDELREDARVALHEAPLAGAAASRHDGGGGPRAPSGSAPPPAG